MLGIDIHPERVRYGDLSLVGVVIAEDTEVSFGQKLWDVCVLKDVDGIGLQLSPRRELDTVISYMGC